MYDTFIRNKAMTVRHEIKSQLAKLLATEDLVVEHKKVETACFNVHTRVLTLPMWEKASNTVYDLLVGHEVGHALYTPDENWLETCKVPPQFVNVVEDVRIEKLMKRRYAGLSKTFYNGYKELAEQDFFQIGDDDVKEYNLADKVNLYYKIGNFIHIPFVEFDEMPIVRMIGECETFSDVLIAAEFLYKFCKKKQQEETKTPMDDWSLSLLVLIKVLLTSPTNPKVRMIMIRSNLVKLILLVELLKVISNLLPLVAKPMKNLKSKPWSLLKRH